MFDSLRATRPAIHLTKFGCQDIPGENRTYLEYALAAVERGSFDTTEEALLAAYDGFLV